MIAYFILTECVRVMILYVKTEEEMMQVVDEWMDEELDGWMDGRMDGRMND